ncbi:MAG: PorT family protein [Cytophagaceae bacterium]|nr:PorT family protein [Cytophagaceae bacterium]
MKYKVLVFLFVQLTSVFVSQAQDPRWTNLPTYDDKTLHYGFSLGMNNTGFKIRESNTYFSDSLTSIYPKRTFGFSLGFIVNLRLHDHFDLRLLPTVAFYERSVQYSYANSFELQTLESTMLEFPLLLKYKSQRRRNSRMYLVGGFKGCIEAGSKKRERKQTELRANNYDFTFDWGVGFDFYFQLFKFSPEIRFSHGIVNMLSQDPNIYSESLTRMSTHTVTIYLHFE